MEHFSLNRMANKSKQNVILSKMSTLLQTAQAAGTHLTEGLTVKQSSLR
jgi:hypothetical protein